MQEISHTNNQINPTLNQEKNQIRLLTYLTLLDSLMEFNRRSRREKTKSYYSMGSVLVRGPNSLDR